MQDIALDTMNDLGLVSTLPLTALICLVVLAISLCFTLARFPANTALVLLHLFGMVWMLHGAASLAEELPRFGPAWRHVGIIEYITRNASVDPKIDAYFNWPGFFIAAGWIQQAAGLDSALPLLKWAPLFFELLYLGPLWLIYRTFTSDKRLIWLAISLFYAANWVGQDYFSPQAANFFFFLVILYILLRWFKSGDRDIAGWLQAGRFRRLFSPAGSIEPELSEPNSVVVLSPLQQTFLYLLVVLLFVISVSSHQLTPFAILSGVTALVLYRLIRPQSLPLLMAVIVTVWFGFMANTYLNGRIGDMLLKVGQVETVVSANVTERLQGSPQHLFILRLRMVQTLAMWGAAILGILRRWRRGKFEFPMLLLFAAPGVLLIFQSYGGEMLLRTYMFSLPFAAFFAAALFFPAPSEGVKARSVVFACAALSALVVMFLFTRYGNERMEYFDAQELDAVNHFYRVAKPGSLLASAHPSMPIKSQQYESFRYLRLENVLIHGDPSDVIRLMDKPRYPEAYFVITRSQIAYMHMFYNLPFSFWEELGSELEASGRMRLIFQNKYARIYQLVPQGEEQ